MTAQNIKIALRWLPHGVGLSAPRFQTAGAAGADLSAAVIEDFVLQPGTYAAVPCGFAMALPDGFEAQVRPRSGLAARHGVTVLNAPGTIDADYRGEVKVLLINHGPEPLVIKRGDRIAQMVIAPMVQAQFTSVEILDETERAEGGFGSTGTG